MRARRTEHSNNVFTLPGGNEDNDLWTHTTTDINGDPVICSTWVPTDEERQRIAAGENVELVIWGTKQPPVALRLDDSKLLGADRQDG